MTPKQISMLYGLSLSGARYCLAHGLPEHGPARSYRGRAKAGGEPEGIHDNKA